jgi:hypothetical protein
MFFSQQKLFIVNSYFVVYLSNRHDRIFQKKSFFKEKNYNFKGQQKSTSSHFDIRYQYSSVVKAMQKTVKKLFFDKCLY